MSDSEFDDGSPFEDYSSDEDDFVDDADLSDFEDEPAAKPTSKKKAAAAPKAGTKRKAAGAAGSTAGKKSPKTAGKKSPSSRASVASTGSGGKAKKVKEADAAPVLQDYMNTQNRPYSVLNIYDNLHGMITKPAVQRVMDALADEEQLGRKEYGKQKVYWPLQEQYGEVSEEDLAGAKAAMLAAGTELNEAKQAKRELEGQVTAMEAALTTEALTAQVADKKSQIESLEAKIARLEGADISTDGNQREKLLKSLKKYRSVWSERRAILMDIVDAMEEGMASKKRKDIIEMLELDMDEAVGVSLKDIKAP